MVPIGKSPSVLMDEIRVRPDVRVSSSFSEVFHFITIAVFVLVEFRSGGPKSRISNTKKTSEFQVSQPGEQKWNKTPALW